jgi:hypothetical protein
MLPPYCTDVLGMVQRLTAVQKHTSEMGRDR